MISSLRCFCARVLGASGNLAVLFSTRETPLTSIQIFSLFFVRRKSNLLSPFLTSALIVSTLPKGEISKSFNEIKSLIGSEQSVKNHTLDSLFNEFCNTLIYGDFGLMFTHAAVLLRPLIRSKYDTLKYPNWQRTDYLADYTILGLLKAVIKSPSLIIGLSFERIRNQLIDPITFKKTGGSTYDSLFQEKE